jgi:hypothetical protein
VITEGGGLSMGKSDETVELTRTNLLHLCYSTGVVSGGQGMSDARD